MVVERKLMAKREMFHRGATSLRCWRCGTTSCIMIEVGGATSLRCWRCGTTSCIIGRAKRAPHWGVQSRFRVIYVGMYVCLSWSKKRRRNYVGQTRACSKSVLGGKIPPVTPILLISTIRYGSFSMDGRETFT